MKHFAYAIALCLLPAFTSLAQSNPPSGEKSSHLESFEFEDTVPLKIVREVVPSKPFSVIGPRGAILGQQDGSFEAQSDSTIMSIYLPTFRANNSSRS